MNKLKLWIACYTQDDKAEMICKKWNAVKAISKFWRQDQADNGYRRNKEQAKTNVI